MGFGKTVRKSRQSMGLSIAQFSQQVNISPTYLAPIEREVFPPPAEDKIIRIAKALNENPDVLLAQAGRVATDLQKIIRKNPDEVGALLRSVKNKPASEIARMAGVKKPAKSAAKKKASKKTAARR
jgi:transcriptional regulator with XRE-family HTH domain